MSNDIASINKDIIVSLRTTEDASLVLTFLEEQKKSMYHTDHALFSQSAKQTLPIRLGAPLIRGFEVLGLTNKESLEKFLHTLLEEITHCSVMTITIALYPTEEIIEQLSIFIKEQISSQVLLEILTDKTLLGGAVIIYNGKFMDLSLKKRLNEYFVKNKFTL